MVSHENALFTIVLVEAKLESLVQLIILFFQANPSIRIEISGKGETGTKTKS